MRDFKRLFIWQKGMLLVDKMYLAAKYFPEEERFGLRSQCIRAVVSIPSNIAEGSAKNSSKDYKRFLEFALGSCFELETQLLIIQQRNWFPAEVLDELVDLTLEEQKMMTSFIDRLT